MQPRILTRFTTIIVFIFTCCLTMNVVANERELAPLLSNDAWRLIADAEAYSQGFTPAIVSRTELKPRTKNIKRELTKRPNSRVKVKFADELQIRLDIHSTPYSRTQQSVQAITELCETLGITLSPTINRPHAEVDALIRKAELRSRKQQPDIGGIYWVNGDSMAVDVAAELFFTMDEVEWVMYKPVFSMLPEPEPRELRYSNPILDATPAQSTVVRPTIVQLFGACRFSSSECVNDISDFDCSDRGGTFLGNGSICAPPKIRPATQLPYYGDDRGTSGACCVAEVCTFITAAACLLAGGVYQGDGILCTVNPCIGACCMVGVCADIVSPQTGQLNCTDLGGAYQGDGTACADPITCPAGNGECCLTSGCVAVVDDAGCFFMNGVFLGVNEDEPPDPCGEGQTDCPALGGPDPATYSLCAEYADYITYLAGDCYIDQVNTAQTSRGATIGCVDTGLTMLPENPLAAQISPDINGDYVVASGAPNNVPTNVFDSECCETISTDVPMCEINAWGQVCASYANSYAVEGLNICLRAPGLFAQSPSILSQPFGSIHTPARVQPQLDMENVGSGIILMHDGTGGVTNAMVEIVSADPTASKFLNLYTEPGGLQIGFELTGDGTVEDLFDLIVLQAGWSQTMLDCDEDPTDPDSDYPCKADETGDNTLGTLPLTACFMTPQSVFANVIVSGNLSPSGMPQIPKTVATPDFAAAGLLAYMSPAQVPFPPTLVDPIGQPEPLPSSAIEPWDPATESEKFVYFNQLIPWPMGGAAIGPTTYIPPTGGAGGWWGGEGMNLFPDAPNPDGFGGQEIYRGSYGYGQFWEDEEGVGINGTFGNGVKVAVLDWSAHLQERTNDVGINLGGIHEEFLAADNTSLRILLEGPATGHDALELLFDENQVFGYSADHGTAVLGVIAARWNPAAVPGDTLETRMLNNVGCLGLVPDATVSFFPLATVDEPDREEQAWYNAIETLDAGDILCASYRPVAVNDTQPTPYYWDDTASYLEIANNLGICSVLAAGDRGVDLAGLEFSTSEGESTNAIVAAAVSPGAPFKRWATGGRASNFSSAPIGDTGTDYQTITVAGWGAGVTTCGKGFNRDNYLGYNTIIYSDQTDAHVVHAQAYTSNFGFTGAAAAQAAGAAAQLQGFTKQIFDIPMGPEVCRQLTAGGKYEGTDRDGNPVLTPAPDTHPTATETGLDSSCDETGGNDTWDWCDADPGNLTGNLNDPRTGMVNAITNPIFDTPNIDSLMFIRGTLVSGTIYSIAAIDANLLIGDPVRTFAHQPYDVPANVPGGPVYYRGSGLTTDLYLTGAMSSPLPSNNALTINVTFDGMGIQQTRLFLQTEMLDHRTGRWRRAGATTVLVQGDEDVAIEVEQASSFVNPSNNEYHLRLITLENAPPNGGPTATYPISYDRVSLTAGAIQH